ncbi:MAG: pantetheine-phosphate adenylyltransferase [Microlunatus sp.]|nr:pantetheine-phosphate adenylyltransferase [Microlunatus sp.]
MRRAACPGSYDPPTRGHLDVIGRTAALFDRVHVLVGNNTAKTGLFTPQERVGLLEEALADLPGVEVHVFDGLVVDYCRSHDIPTVVKGIRGSVDLEYEWQMAQMNRAMTGLETFFVPAAPQWSAVSSSLVRDVARMGGDFDQFVTPGIAARTRQKLGSGA